MPSIVSHLIAGAFIYAFLSIDKGRGLFSGPGLPLFWGLLPGIQAAYTGAGDSGRGRLSIAGHFAGALLHYLVKVLQGP